MRNLIFLAFLLFALMSCDPAAIFGLGSSGDSNNENNTNICDVSGDDDHDGIPNGVEDCLDHVDTDGDGIWDYLDTDSDNDGIPDGAEDSNQDGLVGECKESCVLGSDAPRDQCGPGQNCAEGGVCEPPVTDECMGTETDPTNPDTDGDGIPDDQEGTAVCAPASVSNPYGIRPLSTYDTELYTLAIPADSAISEISLPEEASIKESLLFYELPTPTGPLSAFSITMAPEDLSNNPNDFDGIVQIIMDRLLSPWNSLPENIHIINSGKKTTSIHGNTITIGVTINNFPYMSATDFRNEVVAAILDRPRSELSGLPQTSDEAENSATLSFSVELFKWQLGPGVLQNNDTYLIIHGGFVPTSSFSSNKGHLSHISSGHSYSLPGSTLVHRCRVLESSPPTPLDVIWVVDDYLSGSSIGSQFSTTAAAIYHNLFPYGLDFRMGVIGMSPDQESLCTLSSPMDSFLGPEDLSQFQGCLEDPLGNGDDPESIFGITAGFNALSNHLPRFSDREDRIRTGAHLAIVYASGQYSKELDLQCGVTTDEGLEELDETCVQSLISPTLNLLNSEAAVAGTTTHAFIVPPNGCLNGGGTFGRGYMELVRDSSGSYSSICGMGDDTSTQLADTLAAATSTIVLEESPIPYSIALSANGVPMERESSNGFFYDPAHRTILFKDYGVNYAPSTELVVGYTTWAVGETP